MKKNQLVRRRDKILEILARQEVVLVSQLLEELQVSDETLRKDLIEMEKQGFIKRSHGKVTLIAKAQEEDMRIRTQTNLSVKERIAEEVLRHIPQKDVIVGLDVGSTTLEVAKLLVKEPRITIVTNSLEIATLYAKAGNSNINCTGGSLRGMDLGLYGYWTQDNLRTINMRVAVMGTPGIKDRQGLGAISFDDKEVKQLYARNAQIVIAVFDSTKCVYPSMIDSVSWEDIDIVITDDGISEADRERIGEKTKLIIV